MDGLVSPLSIDCVDKFAESVLTPLAFIRSFKVIAINSEVKAVVSCGRYVIVLP